MINKNILQFDIAMCYKKAIMINIKKIQELRGGLSPYQFAKLVGLDARTILTMERGESVNLSTLKKIADKFNLNIRELVK